MIFVNYLNNVVPWLFIHGIKIVIILAFAYAGIILSKVFISRFLKSLIKRGAKFKRETRIDEERIRTLEKVFYSIARTTIWLIAFVTILPEFGIAIGPLLAGIGVAGLALGLGARSLIQDYISGLFILLEDQYRVGEKVKVAGQEGKVRDFNLRRTVLSGLEGTLYYIPNSQAKVVSNFSRTKQNENKNN